MSTDASQHYDCIIAGAGLSGLALAVAMAGSPKLNKLKILLIDKEPKTANDRTWCFWETAPGPFESCVAHSWKKLLFRGPGYEESFDISPFTYKLIRSRDFYAHCMEIIAGSGFDIVYSPIHSIQNTASGASVTADAGIFVASYVFNSALRPNTSASPGLLQHFKGYIVNSTAPVFEAECPTFMDFNTCQEGDFRFFYQLPFSGHRALVEYTLFSKQLLSEGEYDSKLDEKLSEIVPAGYSVEETEFGIIPMSSYRYRTRNGAIFNLGTAGGNTKASTGYTFVNVMKQTRRLIEEWETTGVPKIRQSLWSRRFYWHDRLMLNVLRTGKHPGDRLMADLFSKNPPVRMLRFLKEESNFWEELRIMASAPFLPFMMAVYEEVFKPIFKK